MVGQKRFSRTAFGRESINSRTYDFKGFKRVTGSFRQGYVANAIYRMPRGKPRAMSSSTVSIFLQSNIIEIIELWFFFFLVFKKGIHKYVVEIFSPILYNFYFIRKISTRYYHLTKFAFRNALFDRSKINKPPIHGIRCANIRSFKLDLSKQRMISFLCSLAN